jgi:GMP synthase-like glutamine amidotransferase
MKPVLLVRNDRYESFGVAPGALAWAGADVLTANATDPRVELPDLADVAGVVTFGGTVNVDQVHEYPHLSRVREYTCEAVERGVPYLGICLGSQILARAAGVQVIPGLVREVGFEQVRPTAAAGDDPLLGFLDGEETVLQWHEDTHELPEGAVLLVTGDRIPVQGYRIGDRAWGLQFHVEVDALELGWWLEVADTEVDLKAVWGKSADEIRDEARTHMGRQEARGRAIFARFADIVREDRWSAR